MACVICGKKQQLLAVDSIKYPSNNILPEVLAIAIGRKIASEDWSEDSKQVCLSCNERCEQFDDLNEKCQNLRDLLLQDYTKRIYQAANPSTEDRQSETNKSIGTDEVQQPQDSENDNSGNSQNEEEMPCQNESDVGENNVEKTAEDEGQNKVEKNPENIHTTVIKNDADSNSDDNDHKSRNLTLPDEVDNSAFDPADEISTKQVIRLVEKTSLRRLPDYEYRQWYSLEGYTYVLHTHNNRGQLLACHKRGCRVTCRVTLQSELVKLVGSHSHEPDSKIQQRNQLYEALKERCMSGESTPLIKIYEEEAQRFSGGASYLPFPEVRMREWRAANDSTVVHTNATTLDETGKKYHCDVCDMGFNSSRLLERHSEKHNNRNILGRKKLSGAESFVSEPLSGDKMKIRRNLDKKLRRVIGKIKAGDDTEGEEGYDCHLCREHMATLATYKKHILEKHSEILMCVHCDVAFDTPLLLKRHQTSCKKCSDERMIREIGDDPLEQELSKITGDDQVETEADVDASDPDWSPTHAAPDDDDDVRPVKRAKKENVPDNKMYKCKVCDKMFTDFQQHHNHLYTHSSRGKYECTTCRRTFNKKAILTRHMIAERHRGRIKLNPPLITSDNNPEKGVRCAWEATKYECAVCAASFPHQTDLLYHMRDQKHITNQIIVHEAQPTQRLNNPVVALVKRGRGRPRKNYKEYHKNKYVVHPEVQNAVTKSPTHKVTPQRQQQKVFPEKQPLECAVCGMGFADRVRLFAHMESLGHLTDSIVENVPANKLQGIYGSLEGNQIVPHQMEDEAVQIKEENIKILSQVIIAGTQMKQELPDEVAADEEQGFYIQAAEGADGETVMVLQGELAGGVAENMQLFMDEEGNIVTHDEHGNTVQVMKVQLSDLQSQQDTDSGEYVQEPEATEGIIFADGSGQLPDDGDQIAQESETNPDVPQNMEWEIPTNEEQSSAQDGSDEIREPSQPSEQQTEITENIGGITVTYQIGLTNETDDKQSAPTEQAADAETPGALETHGTPERKTSESEATFTPRRTTRNLIRTEKAEEAKITTRLRSIRLKK